jgi:hypothetical protein
MKTMKFRQPPEASAAADSWVRSGEAAERLAVPESIPAGKLARLTIDLPPELRDRFKAACAMQRTKMVDEVRRFIEDWTQKHGKV